MSYPPTYPPRLSKNPSIFKSICIFSGNANRALSRSICEHLDAPLGKAKVARFSDGEIRVEIQENVRGKDVYVIQSTCCPVNDNLMELLVMVDALKRASAGSITTIIPYYGYARQDKKVAPRVPITAKLIADLISVAGVDRVVALDLHAGQIQGFFNVPFDHIFAMPVFLQYFQPKFDKKSDKPLVLISPDAGGVERTRAYAKRMGADLAIIDKRRQEANVSEVMHIVGEVKDRICMILDDMIDTAGTLCNAAKALTEQGAREVYAGATHAVLSGPAIQRIKESDLVEVVVTDTIPLSKEAEATGRFKVLSIASLLCETIRRIHYSDSVSSLFV